MTREAQEALELRLVKLFREGCSDFPGGELRHQDAPDFVVADGVLGIEVTGVYRPRSPDDYCVREQESLRRRVMNSAHAKCRQAGLPGLYVSAILGRLSVASLPKLVNTLAELVESNVPPPGERISLAYAFAGAWDDPVLSSLAITRPLGLEDSLWCATSGAEFLAPATPALLQERIDKKEGRIEAYRRSAQAVWLLIVMDDHAASGDFSIPTDLLRHEYSTNFDRVYLMRTSDGWAGALATRASSGPADYRLCCRSRLANQ